jgi:hypothetical protein
MANLFAQMPGRLSAPDTLNGAGMFGLEYLFDKARDFH